MTANPLMLRQPTGSGRATPDSLASYAEDLNRMNWVKASGQPYFVNKRADDDGVKHYLDRKIA